MRDTHVCVSTDQIILLLPVFIDIHISPYTFCTHTHTHISQWSQLTSTLSTLQTNSALIYDTQERLTETLQKFKSVCSDWRIHFGDAHRNVFGQVVEEKAWDVEENLWHVGTEGLWLKTQTQIWTWHWTLIRTQNLFNVIYDIWP